MTALPEIQVQPLLPPAGAEHPLAAKIAAFLDSIGSLAYTVTGLTRDDYLAQIESQVSYFRRFQDAQGRIIDPVDGHERQYATPCYALCAALLVFTGRNGLLDSAVAALSASIDAMASYRPADRHGDFYTYPVMLALDLLRPLVTAGEAEAWESQIRGIDPYRLYFRSLSAVGAAMRRRNLATMVSEGLRIARSAVLTKGRRLLLRSNNWNVAALCGEYLRSAAGLSHDVGFTERHLAHQLPNFDDLGLYREVNRPLAYDHFPRQFLAGILSRAYRGPSFAAYRDHLWRGAWTSLLMMSPAGELPTGGRSAHHIWNEAQSTVTYELYAAAYARAGRLPEAGAFKRAARLSLATVRAWTPDEGPGQVVKNRYEPTHRHGYESYSFLSTYNLLASSLLAVAYLNADDSIKERPCPGEVGGYAVLSESFHKVFAAAGGSYVEYDTRGDQTYNPTGLLRIHLAGVLPQLGPSDGAVSGPDRLCVGPAWQDAAGNWHGLASYQPAAPRLEVLEEEPARVRLRLTYEGSFDGVTRIVETISLDRDGVTITDELTGSFKTMRVLYPMLVFDGAEASVVGMDGASVRVALRGSAVRFSVSEPDGVTLQRSGRRIAHPNGEAEAAYADLSGPSATYRIEAAAR